MTLKLGSHRMVEPYLPGGTLGALVLLWHNKPYVFKEHSVVFGSSVCNT